MKFRLNKYMIWPNTYEKWDIDLKCGLRIHPLIYLWKNTRSLIAEFILVNNKIIFVSDFCRDLPCDVFRAKIYDSACSAYNHESVYGNQSIDEVAVAIIEARASLAH